MNWFLRSFNEHSKDISEMQGLAQSWPCSHLHILDLPYRLTSWALDDPANCVLIIQDKALIGWAALNTPFWTIDLACRPDAEEEIFPQLWDWAWGRAQEVQGGPYHRPAWFVPLFEGDRGAIRALETAGFVDQSQAAQEPLSKVWLHWSTGNDTRVGVELNKNTFLQGGSGKCCPPGFSIRTWEGLAEVDAYVNLHQAAFESKNMTREWRARVISRPELYHDLNLLIEEPGGSPVAFCVGWFSQEGLTGQPCGQIEPLGVHPHYRKLGLGQAVLSEVLRRMVELGAQEIYVETDSYRDAAFRLYESAGFQPLRKVRDYRKDLIF